MKVSFRTSSIHPWVWSFLMASPNGRCEVVASCPAFAAAEPHWCTIALPLGVDDEGGRVVSNHRRWHGMNIHVYIYTHTNIFIDVDKYMLYSLYLSQWFHAQCRFGLFFLPIQYGSGGFVTCYPTNQKLGEGLVKVAWRLQVLESPSHLWTLFPTKFLQICFLKNIFGGMFSKLQNINVPNFQIRKIFFWECLYLFYAFPCRRLQCMHQCFGAE